MTPVSDREGFYMKILMIFLHSVNPFLTGYAFIQGGDGISDNAWATTSNHAVAASAMGMVV
jgi:hypothetical protein